MNIDKYIGRPYEFGKTDCYTLVREWYNNETSLKLGEYPRPADWFDAKHDLFTENYAKEGFRVMDIPFSELRVGDMLLCAINSDYVNHCLVVVGQDMVLHHFTNRTSVVEKMSRLIRNTCMAILRHPGLVLNDMEQEKVELKDVDPQSLIRRTIFTKGQ